MDGAKEPDSRSTSTDKNYVQQSSLNFHCILSYENVDLFQCLLVCLFVFVKTCALLFLCDALRSEGDVNVSCHKLCQIEIQIEVRTGLYFLQCL